MYKVREYSKTQIKGIESFEGEPIEHKVRRILNNGEPIGDGAPLIYEEKKDGVNPDHDIRTDRWEVATEAMDKVHRFEPKTDDKIDTPEGDKEKESKVIEMEGKESHPVGESAQGAGASGEAS